MAACRSTSEWKLPRRMRLRVRAEMGLPPGYGGIGSEHHAAASMVTPSLLARASAGVR
jgi:hypothetical protein